MDIYEEHTPELISLLPMLPYKSYRLRLQSYGNTNNTNVNCKI